MTARQQKQHDRQRERVLEYAMDQFKRKGIRSVKMDDMATALSMSKRTLYAMFGDKERLLVESLQHSRIMNMAQHERMKAECSYPLELYVRAMHQLLRDLHDVSPLFFSDLKRYDEALTTLRTESKDRDNTTLELMHRCVDMGLFRLDIDYNIMSRVLGIMGRAIMEHALYEEFSVSDIVRVVSLTSVRGLCTEKGLAMLDELVKKERSKSDEYNNNI